LKATFLEPSFVRDFKFLFNFCFKKKGGGATYHCEPPEEAPHVIKSPLGNTVLNERSIYIIRSAAMLTPVIKTKISQHLNSTPWTLVLSDGE
jgi:hypothetical protein